MRPPDMRNGPPPQGPAAHITAPTKAQHPDGSAIPRVTARAYAPCGRRRLGVLVATCPYCGGAHVHRGTGGIRGAGCGRGHYYVVAVPAVPAVTRGGRASC